MSDKELIIIGDRILISPDPSKEKTESGLYLPQGLAEKEKVQGGSVVKTGPGYILPAHETSEPWFNSKNEPRYVPLQVEPGDYAIFLKREAIEVEYEKSCYLIVPQSAVLAVVREESGMPEQL